MLVQVVVLLFLSAALWRQVFCEFISGVGRGLGVEARELENTMHPRQSALHTPGIGAYIGFNDDQIDPQQRNMLNTVRRVEDTSSHVLPQQNKHLL